jgi:hypothetical protein
VATTASRSDVACRTGYGLAAAAASPALGVLK